MGHHCPTLLPKKGDASATPGTAETYLKIFPRIYWAVGHSVGRPNCKLFQEKRSWGEINAGVNMVHPAEVEKPPETTRFPSQRVQAWCPTANFSGGSVVTSPKSAKINLPF